MNTDPHHATLTSTAALTPAPWNPKYVAVALQRIADMGLTPRLADG